MNRFTIVCGLLSSLLAFAPPAAGQSTQERKAKIEALEKQKTSKEATDRKRRSIERLKKEGVPVLETLPAIADSTQAKKRTAEEIAHRAIAVLITALKGEGLEQGLVDSIVKDYGAEKFFSPAEAKFIKDGNPSQRDKISFSWRYECAWVLLWSLGYVDTLSKPEGICDVPKLVTIFQTRGADRFIKEAKLRPIGEILDQADLIYRCNWAVTSARVKQQPPPEKLEPGVVHERHYALNWLIGYMDQEWDEITTDT